jgi:hypothetical protein
MKPGYKTTEFWVALAAQVVSMLMLLGVITPEQSSVLNETAGQSAVIVNQVIGIVGVVGASFGYAVSRGLAKKE